MWKETKKYSENEAENKRLSEAEQKTEQIKLLHAEKKKAEIKEHIKADEALTKLHNLLDSHDVELDIEDVEHLQKALSGDELNHDDIEDILEKIDTIENSDDIDDYIPTELRITKQEYHNAIIDDSCRKNVIKKLDWALTIISNNMTGWTMNMWGNIFWGYMAMLDKQLIAIQEHHIDMQDHLKSIS